MDKKALYIFIIIFCLLISGCAQREGQSVDEILVRLMEVSGENIEDSGSFYFSCATEGEIGYFSNDNKKLMYGEDSTEQIFDKIETEIKPYIQMKGVMQRATVCLPWRHGCRTFYRQRGASCVRQTGILSGGICLCQASLSQEKCRPCR